jgi:hypothetical protein
VTLDEARAGTGRPVIFRRTGCLDDRGVIKRVGPSFAFVVYDGACQPVATDPADLTFADEERGVR